MLEINEIWYIIPIYNILSAQISSSPRAGRETFTNPNFPLRPPGPQIASLRSEMSYDLSKKNRGAQNHSNEPRTNPPSGVSKCREFYLAWTGGVETKKNAGPNKVRPWRAPKIPVEWKLNTVFIFVPRGDHSRAFSAKWLPSTTPTSPRTIILTCLLSNSEVRGG